MIFDAEKAFMDYFKNNMEELTGSGNVTVGVYRPRFPDNATASGISIFAEIPGKHDCFDLFPVAIRINARHQNTGEAFRLIQNVDNILDDRHHLNLNDDVELCNSNRNAGPDKIEGVEDNLAYFSCLYEMILRTREND